MILFMNVPRNDKGKIALVIDVLLTILIVTKFEVKIE